jgi:ketosteroid isomerase-like protein
VAAIENGREAFGRAATPRSQGAGGSQDRARYWAAMSNENVEIVREMWETVLTDDHTTIPASFIDPEVTYEDEILPDHAGETYRGYDGMQRAWTWALESFEDEPFDNRILWVRDAGDAVVTCHHVCGRGRGSGVELEFDYAYLWRLRAGRVIYCKSFRVPAQALEAAGLSE